MMKNKIWMSVLLLILTLACNLGNTPSTEVAPPAPPTPDTVPTDTPIAPTTVPSNTFMLSVLVDTASEPVSQEQAQTLVDEASGIFFGLTGFTLEMIDFRESAGGIPMNTIVEEYVNSVPPVIPNGSIVFSYGDNGMAKLYGGYAYAYAGPGGFVNQFVSPYATENDLYVGVIHFSHRYARCGYGDSETPISNVSVGGECFNQPGTACVEKYGYSMCSTAVDNVYASTPTYFSSTTFVHEIMHPFGPNGNQDHYWTPECTAAMQSGISTRPYQAAFFDREQADSYVNMCPFVFDNFVNSYRP